MSDLRKAAEAALEALEIASRNGSDGLKRYELKELDDAITALRTVLAQPEQEPVAWVLDGDKDCRYSHWLGQTQFGRILITWKGWKECCDASVDEFPGGFKAYGSPDEVKAACETELIRRCGCNLSQRNPLSLDAINKVCAAPHLTVSDFVRAIEKAHGIGGES